MAKHEVVRDKAVELFAAMGFKMADKWDDGELMKKVRKISDIVPDGFDPDPGLADVYLGLTEAIEKGDEIVLVFEPETGWDDEPEESDEAEVGGEGKEDGVEVGTSAGPDRPDVVVAEPEDEPPTEPAVEAPKKSRKARRRKGEKPPQEDKPEVKKKRGEAGPKIDGEPVHIRSIRNRLFCAGQVIRDNGLKHGLSDELIKELDDRFGKPNLTASKNQLNMAWHVLNGYLNG